MSQRGAPTLSVVIPSFGYAHYIRDSIDSVLREPGAPVEVVVQDGGSTDGTLELLAGYEGRVSWRSEPDEGQSDALNRAIARATGRWVGWLNADEFYLPGGLARLVAEGDRTGADVVYGDTVFVDADGGLTRLLPQHRFNRFALRSYGPIVSTVSAIFRRSTLGDAPIDVEFRRMMDWELYLRFADAGRRFQYVPVPVGAFRAHDTRVTATEQRVFLKPLYHGGGFGREYEMLARRYGALRMRRIGHIVHGVEKLAAGSYLRQLRARAFRGADMRWFRSQAAAEHVERFRSRVYGASGR